jgi:D-alanine-D-alanine ligase
VTVPVRNRRGAPTLGPVASLEAHLPREWWRHLFDALYILTDGDVVEDDTATAAEIDLVLRTTGISSAARVLDLCCGQGRHLLELARRGFRRLAGVDQSAYLLALARRRARQRGVRLALTRADARLLARPVRPADAVLILGNSLGYFESEDGDRAVLASARRALAPGGWIVLDLADGAWLRRSFEPRSWEWLSARHLVCRERELARAGDRIVCREVIVDTYRGVIGDRFYAERLYTPTAVARLLRATGFEPHDGPVRIATEAAPGHDIGLMGRRFLMIARAGEPAAPARARPAKRTRP